jgi:hypothetical protein
MIAAQTVDQEYRGLPRRPWFRAVDELVEQIDIAHLGVRHAPLLRRGISPHALRLNKRRDCMAWEMVVLALVRVLVLASVSIGSTWREP